jgi:hypothetical protein
MNFPGAARLGQQAIAGGTLDFRQSGDLTFIDQCSQDRIPQPRGRNQTDRSRQGFQSYGQTIEH